MAERRRALPRAGGYAHRSGKHVLSAGLGYGGSCCPKDVRALAQMAAYAGCHPQLLHAVMAINRDQRTLVADKVRLGLAFKPNTDDMRAAPSVDLAERFLADGASMAGYDPQATATARAVLDGTISPSALVVHRACDKP